MVFFSFSQSYSKREKEKLKRKGTRFYSFSSSIPFIFPRQYKIQTQPKCNDADGFIDHKRLPKKISQRRSTKNKLDGNITNGKWF